MYTMKQACELTNLSYETLKFYCNQGLIPNVKRDERNHRVFDEMDIGWIKGLGCLKSCNLSIAEMKHYIDLLAMGESSIPELKAILAEKRKELVKMTEDINAAVEYIDWKQGFFDELLAGKKPDIEEMMAVIEKMN